MLENVPGARADIRAKVVDFNETGIRIHVSMLLQTNHEIVVKTQTAGLVPHGRAKARVVDCRALTGSGYSVGLTFKRAGEAEELAETPVMDSHQVLTLNPDRNVRLRMFDPSETAAAKESERAKRRGILELLYTARRSQPGRATVSLQELEELLGCPREQLDFSLWYLDQSAFIDVSENGDYSITVSGVDQLEAEEAAELQDERLLAAGE